MSESSFGSLGSKVLSAANTLAPLLGAAAGWLTAPMADGRGFAGAPAFMIDRLKGWKIANPITTTEKALNFPEAYPIISGAIGALTGLGIKEVGETVGIGPIKSMGSALLKFGSSAALNAIIAAWVWEAKFNPHGEEGGPATGAGNAYKSTSPSTIDVDNPQGLAQLYPGQTPDYSTMM